MAGNIVSIVNRKGGVGKTTLTIGLADALIEEIDRSSDDASKFLVVVDLDPQASLTSALLNEGKAITEEGQLAEVLRKGCTFAKAVSERLQRKTAKPAKYLTHGVGRTGFHFSLLANEDEGWNVEREGLRKHGPEKLNEAVASLLGQLSDEFRYVLVDCPPGQTLFAEAAIKSSDLELAPQFWTGR